jgi:hypothetical protein
MVAEDINNQVNQSLRALRDFKALLIAPQIPLTVKIGGVTYAVADLTDEEIIYYDKFIRDNYNCFIDGLEEATNAMINYCMDNPGHAVWDTYLYFKRRDNNFDYDREMIRYSLDVHIYNEPLRAEYYDEKYAEWYPSRELQQAIPDGPNHENISVEVRNMAWHGLLEVIGHLGSIASSERAAGFRMVYNR